MTTKHIDILQAILDRIAEAEDNKYPEFTNSTGYAMAIKDLALLQGLDPDNYGVKTK